MSKMCDYSFFSDSEGPLCLNDNAFELAQHFIPQGERLFTQLSAYDDYLVDVVHRPDYYGGDTLKLILPFFKAYGITEADIEKFSAGSVKWVPDAPETLRQIRSFMPVSIVTTSYEQFARPMYRGLGLDDGQIFCTKLELDRYRVSDGEAAWLKTLAQEIIGLPTIDPHRLPTQIAARLDKIFWQEICETDCAGLFNNTTIMSGGRKAAVIAEKMKQHGDGLSRTMFVGDSITDVEAFRLLRAEGGLAMSFNGNQFALEEAEVTCISPTAAVTGILAREFSLGGRSRVINFINHQGQKRELPLEAVVAVITSENVTELTRKSLEMRKILRGEKTGALG